MPAVAHPELGLGEPPSTARSYHHLSFSHLCTGLVLLTILAIFRLIACRVLSSATSKKVKVIQRHKPVADDISRLVNQQRLHHLFIPDGGWIMEKKSRGVSSSTQGAGIRSVGSTDSQTNFTAGDEKELGEVKETGCFDDTPSGSSTLERRKPSDLSSTRFMLSRPPPPPPLTPPEMSPSIFTYDERRRSFTSGVSELDASFFEQPNPDYMSFTSTGTSTATQNTRTTQSFATPRRRSYTKILPIGVPPPLTGRIFDEAEMTFSPSSYPPTSPLLPGPPPIYGEIRYDEVTKQEILVQGEIISALDDSGAGWKRHTRVYGGGVCLACAASGDDGHHGGFYGENVLPEEKRY